MYLPSHFMESRLEVLHTLIRSQPLAVLVTLSSTGLEANHMPFYLASTPGEPDRLLGHVARQNPVWRDTVLDTDVLVIFQGPASYISPSWYPTKKTHGQVVPTWNYVVVHAYGVLKIHDDPTWVRTQVEQLTHQQESTRATPWAVTDAPPTYVERMTQHIVGLEVGVRRLIGKWKVSQNQTSENRMGVAVGLEEAGQPSAAEMAQLIRGDAAEGRYLLVAADPPEGRPLSHPKSAGNGTAREK